MHHSAYSFVVQPTRLALVAFRGAAMSPQRSQIAGSARLAAVIVAGKTALLSSCSRRLVRGHNHRRDHRDLSPAEPSLDDDGTLLQVLLQREERGLHCNSQN